MPSRRPVHRSLPLFLWCLFVPAMLAQSLAAQNPIASWRPNESASTSALDDSATGDDAFLSTGTKWIPGSEGRGISATTTNYGLVAIPAIDLRHTQAITITLWTNWDYTTTDKSGLFASGSGNRGSAPGFALLPNDKTCNGVQVKLQAGRGTTANCYTSPPSQVRHFLAVIFDTSRTAGDAIAFYVDGILQSPTRNLSAAASIESFGNNPIYLFSKAGTSPFNSGTTEEFQLEEFQLYDSALDATQIQKLYVEGKDGSPTQTGLVAAYSFNEGSGSTVADASGNGNTGTITHAIWTDEGRYGKALVFDGIDSLVTVADSTSLHLRSAMTLEAWVQPSTIPSVCRDVIHKGLGDYHLQAAFENTGYPGGGARIAGSDAVSYARAQLPTDTWTHLAVAYDGSALRVFVNGQQVSNRPYRGSIASSETPLQIGGDSRRGCFFSGVIDEVRIYNRALTQAQIQKDMNTPIEAVLMSIAIAPQNPTLAIGERKQLVATATYSDGSRKDLTHLVQWVSSDNSIATVDASGVALALAKGNAKVEASLGSTVGTIEISNGAPGFTIAASPSAISVAQGKQGTSTITTTIIGDFDSSINLSAYGMPPDTSVSFNPNPIPAPGAGNSTMTLSVGANTAPGTYPIMVLGAGGTIQHTTTVTLTVTAAPTFSISASPASLSVAQGKQGTSTITTTGYNGFNSAISLSASGVPTGTTVGFNPNPIPAPGSGNSNMTITVGAATPVGTYPITVTGNGGGTQHTTTVTLTVTAAMSHQVSLSWNASVDPVIGYNMYRSLTHGGPYTKLNSTLIATTSYLDLTVQSGYTYYYVATAVNAQQQESAYSNEAVAKVP